MKKTLSLCLLVCSFASWAEEKTINKTVVVPISAETPTQIKNYIQSDVQTHLLFNVKESSAIKRLSLKNGRLSKTITKITPLTSKIVSLDYQKQTGNAYNVQAVVEFETKSLLALSEKLTGLAALSKDNALLTKEIAQLKSNLYADRASSLELEKLEAMKISDVVDAESKANRFRTGASLKAIPKYIDYSRDDLDKLSTYYARIYENAVVSAVKFHQPEVTVNHIHKDEYEVILKWRYEIPLDDALKGKVATVGKNGILTPELPSYHDTKHFEAFVRNKMKPIILTVTSEDGYFYDDYMVNEKFNNTVQIDLDRELTYKYTLLRDNVTTFDQLNFDVVVSDIKGYENRVRRFF